MTAWELDADGRVPQHAVDAFDRDGFFSIRRLIDDEALDALRRAYDEIVVADVSTDRQLGGITKQVMVPSMHHPMFEDNAALDAARRIVGQIYGSPTAARTYDMLIDKPAGHPHETPWHQDAGYFSQPVAPTGMPIPFRSVQVWLALDDADADNGCMQFVPRRHREGVLEHVVVSGDPDDEGRLIGLSDPSNQLDLTERIVAAVPAGGCTMHLAGTPHYTAPNGTADRRRRAYIFNLDPSAVTHSPIEPHLRQQYVASNASRR